MNARMSIRVAALTAALWLAGCANMSTDPREGGFFGGVSGLNSGAYDERLREREARLAQMRETQRALETETGQLQARKSAVHQQVRADQIRLNQLNTDISGLEQKVGSLSRQQGADPKRAAELKTRLETLKRQSTQQQSALNALEGSGLGDAEMDLRRRQLEEQRTALRREYELLMKMQLELAR